MDTNLKNNKQTRKHLILAMVLVVFCAFVTYENYEGIKEDYREKNAAVTGETTLQTWPNYNDNSSGTTDLKSFIRYMYVGSYGMYWQLLQSEAQKELTPSEIFLASEESTNAEYFDENFKGWFDSFQSLLQSYDVSYQIKDLDSGASFNSSAQSLSGYENAEAPFFLKMTFDKEGSLSLGSMKNAGDIQLTVGEVGGMTKAGFLQWIDLAGVSTGILKQPSNVEIYIYSPDSACYLGRYGTGTEKSAGSVVEEQFRNVYVGMLLLIAVCAWLLPFFKKLRREMGWMQRIPVEGALAAVFLTAFLEGLGESICFRYVLYGGTADLTDVLFNMLLYIGIYSMWFVAVLVLLQMLDMPVQAYFQERSIILRSADKTYGGVKRFLKNFIRSIKEIDLGEKSDQWLLRITAVNFVILFFGCIVFNVGIFTLLVYSVVLFFLLRRYVEKVKKDYGVLMEAASKMAKGDLQVDMEADMGVFEPFKEELAMVNQGFKKAVEEEIKSQSMKTELITNVSHDLKTPLTAIITYVNLLKDENITPEDRKAYVEVLDRKSLRLKNLIEDLFEVSKAASGNIKIEKTPVDLGEMVRQAAAEQEDRLLEAKIDCRIQVPEERPLMMLDGEKTYRILENLLVNVSKYALPGTRAWISVSYEEHWAEMVVKNVSAMELDADTSQLTERFTRGDKARNTEGSGLGLAIVKSFAQLQGGSFEIVVDGDLFKAIVRLPKESPKE